LALTLLTLWVAPGDALASAGHWGDWDVRPRSTFLDVGVAGWVHPETRCVYQWRYVRLAGASLDVGLRCSASESFAWEVAPQVSWDSAASGFSRVVPGVRIKGVGNFVVENIDGATLGASLSYVVAPTAPREPMSNAGFHASALNRWMDIWESDIALALMFSSENRGAGWLLEARQSIPVAMRLGGLAGSSAVDVLSLGAERVWWQGGWRYSAGLGGMALRIDNIRISFLYPRAGISYDF
jgi:hypothetical protein